MNLTQTSLNPQNRQEYWDNYIDYWLKRVADSNTQSENADKMPDDQVMARYIKLLVDSIQLGGGQHKILDYGCGFGRAYPYFEKLDCLYHGCDIATSCIDHTLQSYPKAIAKKLLENDTIPFEVQSFDGVFCYGVFDACYQHITLAEIMRVLKIGGVALITGKNNDYLDSDEMALVAEVGARKNNHPNFFTDTKQMIATLEQRGFQILESRFFLERKDNANETFTHDMPDRFYTYILLVQKREQSILKPFEPFSDTHSQTFKRKDSHL